MRSPTAPIPVAPAAAVPAGKKKIYFYIRTWEQIKKVYPIPYKYGVDIKTIKSLFF